MRVFLTGGTGLIGSHVAEDLRRLGHEVVALHRRRADVGFLRELGCYLIEGDVRDEADALAAGLNGCTHLVHSAALIYASGEWPKVRAVNVDGTRNVLTAAVRAGVKHAVHVSTVAVYGNVDGVVDESREIDGDLPTGDLYARSKREAEEVARGIELKRGLSVTVIRPSAVYGERDRLMIPALLRFLRLPVIPLLGPGRNTLPVVYAGNVASAIRLTLEAARAGTTYDVAHDSDISQRELFSLLAEGLGFRRARFLSIPAPIVRAGGTLLARLGVKTPGAAHLPMDRVTRLALNDNPYPSRAIRADLGWRPSHEHADALVRTGRWAANARRPALETQ